MTPPKHKWSKRAIRELHAYYMVSERETYASIGRRYGLTGQAISSIFRQEKLPPRPAKNQVGQILEHKLVIKRRGRMALALRRKGLKDLEIVAELNLSSLAVLATALRSLNEVVLRDATESEPPETIPWKVTDIVTAAIVVKKAPVPGECRLVDCMNPAIKRGLCVKCHQRVRTRGMLDEVGLPSRTTGQRSQK